MTAADLDRTSFAAEVSAAGDDLSPGRAGLLLAREVAYPNLEASAYLARFDQLAETARPHVHAAGPAGRGLALAAWLFDVQGFRGNAAHYADPRNSYLNDVLDRRLGIPISLSVVYLEVAARLGVAAHGVGLPGHFIVSAPGEVEPLLLDPFHGGRSLTVADCAALVRQSAGYSTFDPQWLAPTPARDVVARMLNNLRQYYLSVEDWPLAVKIAERLAALQPGVAAHLRDLGLLHYRAGAYRKASAQFNEYLLREPNAADAAEVRQARDRLLDELARLN